MRQCRVAKLISPEECRPPHRITHPAKYTALVIAFSTTGWDPNCPPLVGYQHLDGIQLLSGSHRWAAAIEAKIDIPIVAYTYEEVCDAFGSLRKWASIMEGK